LVLVFLASRIAGGAGALVSRRGQLLISFALLVWIGTGPFTNPVWWKSNFTQSVSWLFFWQETEPLELPEIYSFVDKGPVIEAPWNYVFRFSFFVEAYQRQHGHDVLVLPTKPLWSDPRLSMSSSLAMDLDRILESKATWLIVHEDPVSESTLDPVFLPWRGFRKGYFVERETRNREMMMETEWLRLQGPLATWQGRMGPPDHRREGIALWNLDRVRSRPRS
jgi:hypothetical protein